MVFLSDEFQGADREFKGAFSLRVQEKHNSFVPEMR